MTILGTAWGVCSLQTSHDHCRALTGGSRAGPHSGDQAPDEMPTRPPPRLEVREGIKSNRVVAAEPDTFSVLVLATVSS